MKIRRLTAEGLEKFREWLVSGEGDDPPSVLLTDGGMTESCLDEEVDESH